MIDFGQLLHQKTDLIVEKWVDAVRQDQEILTTDELTYKAVRNSLPDVLRAMATIVSETQSGDLQMLVSASLEHGVVRAEQGFEPSEIAREYRLLRSIVFSSLEADLVQGSPAEMLRAVRLIDMVIDEAIARCFNSYTDGRLQELEQLQTQLRLTNQELTRLVRTSQTNLSHLAHELKTPLTSIIGYSDLFLRQQRGGELRNTLPNLESIERVLAGGRQLLRLINDALELSRYEAGQMRLQPTWIDVCPLLQTVLEMVTPLADAKQLQVATDLEAAPKQVWSDQLRLQQIVTNLLSNAIRYTTEGEIKVRCWQVSDQEWAIADSDQGIGIDLEEQRDIFQPYFRGTLGKQTEPSEGTGLGLAIVSRLVKLLQGKIELVSEVNVGSTFTVFLPCQVTPQADALSASPGKS